MEMSGPTVTPCIYNEDLGRAFMQNEEPLWLKRDHYMPLSA